MLDNGIVGLRENGMRLVVGRAKPPKAVVYVSKKLNNASQIVFVANAKMGNPVANLLHLLQLCFPQFLWR